MKHLIILILGILITSCGMPKATHIITEDGVSWYSDTSEFDNVKTVIAKSSDRYYYYIAFSDGTQYYATFGEYSIINIGDKIVFKNKKLLTIVNIIRH